MLFPLTHTQLTWAKMKKIILYLIYVINLVVFSVVPGTAVSKTFTFLTVDFPPYYGKHLPNKGWVSEIAVAALETQGYDVEVTFVPWTQAVRETKEGHHDALLGAYYTEERADLYYFSAPLAQVRTGLFKRKEADISFTELEELKGYKIGIVEGYATSKKFDAADYLNKIPITSLDMGLKMLYEGALDLVADSQVVGNFRLKAVLEKNTSGISDRIEFIQPVLAMNKIYVAISKKAPNADVKLIDFNQGLRKIYLNGTFRKIKMKHSKYIQYR
jgi:polar amino acid transport system substrate-binding protein